MPARTRSTERKGRLEWRRSGDKHRARLDLSIVISHIPPPRSEVSGKGHSSPKTAGERGNLALLTGTRLGPDGGKLSNTAKILLAPDGSFSPYHAPNSHSLHLLSSVFPGFPSGQVGIHSLLLLGFCSRVCRSFGGPSPSLISLTQSQSLRHSPLGPPDPHPSFRSCSNINPTRWFG